MILLEIPIEIFTTPILTQLLNKSQILHHIRLDIFLRKPISMVYSLIERLLQAALM